MHGVNWTIYELTLSQNMKRSIQRQKVNQMPIRLHQRLQRQVCSARLQLSYIFFGTDKETAEKKGLERSIDVTNSKKCQNPMENHGHSKEKCSKGEGKLSNIYEGKTSDIILSEEIKTVSESKTFQQPSEEKSEVEVAFVQARREIETKTAEVQVHCCSCRPPACSHRGLREV